MTIRPVDANGDMLPVQTIDQLASGSKAIAQAIRHRLNLHYGEWWEDETLGFRVPQFLIDTARTQDASMLARYISKYITDTPEVTGVVATDVGMKNRQLIFVCAALTEEGSELVEVNLDVLL